LPRVNYTDESKVLFQSMIVIICELFVKVGKSDFLHLCSLETPVGITRCRAVRPGTKATALLYTRLFGPQVIILGAA
jgi:hypothetical protein